MLIPSTSLYNHLLPSILFYLVFLRCDRSVVTLALTLLTSSQAILIVWSKRAGKYEYSVTTANFSVRKLCLKMYIICVEIAYLFAWTNVPTEMSGFLLLFFLYNLLLVIFVCICQGRGFKMPSITSCSF